MPMKILYLGPASGTSMHRVDALLRLGHSVLLIDPNDFLPKNRIMSKWVFETGALFLEEYVCSRILSKLRGLYFDVVLVNGGELLGPRTVNTLKKLCNRIANYNNDNPFVSRDKNKWRLYLKAIPYYDLLIVMRNSNIAEAYQYGAKNVLRVFMSADEIIHAPKQLTNAERSRWYSEVLFIGTWFPERGALMARLVELGLPLTIYGSRWQKATEWKLIKSYWKGRGLEGNDYAKSIQCAKISLGLLSKGNEDLHTRRSMEIPAIGSLLCAERTLEHLQLYNEGEEAIFWASPEECASQCFRMLRDNESRERIARSGRERCLRNGWFNTTVMSKIVNAIAS
jgi:spore maturation protein CgeB